MDNLVPILLYIRNFREYRHRDCRDGSPRFVVSNSIQPKNVNPKPEAQFIPIIVLGQLDC